MTITFGDSNNVDPVENLEVSGTSTISGQLTVNGNIIMNPVNGFHLDLLSTTSVGGFRLTKNTNEQQGQFYISNFGEKDIIFEAVSTITAMGVHFRTNGNPRLRLGQNGEIGINGSNGNIGDVLTSNGTGAASWTTPPGATTYTAGTGISLSGNTISVNAQNALHQQTIDGVNFTRLAVNLTSGWYDTGWPFFVNGAAYINSLYVGNGTPVTSDDRLKHNETDITNGLAVIRKLQPQTYQKTNEMKAADFKGEIQGYWHWECGLIAQDVLKIPELKHCVFRGDYTDDSGKFIEREYFVRYNDIFTHNIAATKELDKKVTTLEATIQDLLKRIENLEGRQSP